MFFSYCKEFLQSQPIWLFFFSSLGFISLIKHSFFFLKWIFLTFFKPLKNLKTCYGSWAIITGSTDGIGKAFAFELATQDLNLILISRNPKKLKQVSQEIQQKYPRIEIKVLAINFSCCDDLLLLHGEIERVIQGLDVGVLINNVGITYPKAMYFHEVDEQIWMNIVRVNLESTTRVTKVVLQGMLRRKRGAIVNIGSGASIVVPSHPLYAIYASTKAYIDQLSRSLHVEYKSQGIDVQCQVPLYVVTKMASRVANIEKPSATTPTAEDYVKAAVRRIGGGAARCCPYWSHSMQWWFASLIPNPWLYAWRLSTGIHRRSTHV